MCKTYLELLPNDVFIYIFKIIHIENIKPVLQDIEKFNQFTQLNHLHTYITRSSKFSKKKFNNDLFFILRIQHKKWYDYYHSLKKQYNFTVDLHFVENYFYDFFKNVIVSYDFIFYICNNDLITNFDILSSSLWIDLWKYFDDMYINNHIHNNTIIIIVDKKQKFIQFYT